MQNLQRTNWERSCKSPSNGSSPEVLSSSSSFLVRPTRKYSSNFYTNFYLRQFLDKKFPDQVSSKKFPAHLLQRLSSGKFLVRSFWRVSSGKFLQRVSPGGFSGRIFPGSPRGAPPYVRERCAGPTTSSRAVFSLPRGATFPRSSW